MTLRGKTANRQACPLKGGRVVGGGMERCREREKEGGEGKEGERQRGEETHKKL